MREFCGGVFVYAYVCVCVWRRMHKCAYGVYKYVSKTSLKTPQIDNSPTSIALRGPQKVRPYNASEMIF